MKTAAVLLLFGLCLSLSSAPAILLPTAAAPYERTAAGELSHYLGLLSGEAFEVSQAAGEAPAIHVGRSPEALGVFGLDSWEELASDEVLYRAMEDGSLWIAGEGTRGTLYAVYELLEREYGVRFLAEDEELVPVPVSFSLPAPGTFVRYAPPFMQRAAAWQTIMEGSPAFKAKTRTNAFTQIPAEWGGSDGILLGVHTFDKLIGQENYASHPEWFAVRNGVRLPGPKGQLCLTNAGVRRKMAQAVGERLRENRGGRRIVGVSQNDNQNYCLCDACRAFVESHGNQTDLLLDFVNEVADAVAEEFPGVYVETLAYNYTRTPPKTIRPRPNVAIRYCTIEVRSFFRLESEQNRRLSDEILAWRKVAPKMLFWNYLTAFTRFYLPHPNWDALAEDIRLFRASGAISVFEQGALNACGRIADLGDLRAYATSRLLWNPDLDPKEVVREFCERYYGPGSPAVLGYIAMASEQARLHPEAKDTCYPPNADSWLPDKPLVHAWRELHDCAMKYRDDPKYGLRLAVAALPVTMTLLERPQLLEPPPEVRLPELRDVVPSDLIDWCAATLEAADAGECLCENGSLTTKYWLSRVRGRYSHRIVLPDVPYTEEPPPGLPETRYWRAWNVEEINRTVIGDTDEMCRRADDPAAVGGRAVRMPNTHREWFVQLSRLPRAVFDIYLTVRCDAKRGMAATGDVLSCGNYPDGPEHKVSAEECAGGEYRTVFVGRSDLSKAVYFYCAPVPNDTVAHVWIDRFVVANPTDWVEKIIGG